MNVISGSRPNLSDLPSDCIGQVVNQLAALSTPRKPLFRSLLRWSQTNKAMQAQLADWTRQYARPADHVAQAFENAFQSEAPVTRTLRTAKRFAMHLTADLMVDASSFRATDYGLVLFSAHKLALFLVAIAREKQTFPQGVVKAFLEKLETSLVPKQGDKYVVTGANIRMLEDLTRSLFKVCGLSLRNSAVQNAYAGECITALLMLPQSMKSVAMESAFKMIGIWDNEKFDRLFVEAMDQFVPPKWDDSFMGSALGEATLNACDYALLEFGDRSEKFLTAYSNLLGGFIARLPAGQRDFRTLCSALPVCDGLFADESGGSFYDSDDSEEGLLPAQRKLLELLDRVTLLFKIGRLSESGRQAFIRDFVDAGLLTINEFDVLMDQFSREGRQICSFKELGRFLDSQENASEKAVKRSKRKCVIS